MACRHRARRSGQDAWSREGRLAGAWSGPRGPLGSLTRLSTASASAGRKAGMEKPGDLDAHSCQARTRTRIRTGQAGSVGGSAAAAAAAREGRWGRKAASQNHAWCRNSRLLILNCEARPAGRWAWAWAWTWAAVGDNCPRWHCGVRWEHGQSHLADTTPRRQCAIWTPACTVQTVSARRLKSQPCARIRLFI